MRWQQPAARLARRSAAGAGVGGGEVGCPLRPAAPARNLQEAAGPGEGARAPTFALGSWADGKQGSLGRKRRKGRQGGGEGRMASSGASRPPLRSGPRVTAGAAALPSRFPQRPIWRRLARPERLREPRRWRDFAQRSERRADLYPAWERVRAPPGDCSVWRAKLRDGPHRAGSQRAQLGDQAGWRKRPRAASPPPASSLPAGSAPTQPRLPPPSRAVAEPGPPALVPCVLLASLTALFTGTASASSTPSPLRRVGWPLPLRTRNRGG